MSSNNDIKIIVLYPFLYCLRAKGRVFSPFVLQKLQKHARSKCAVLQKFAPLLRAGFRNFFANHFWFGIFLLKPVSSPMKNFEIFADNYAGYFRRLENFA
jgi:hypothetical protein